MVGNERLNMPQGLHFEAKDYLQLVDDTGRIIRHDKRGQITAGTTTILNRLNIPIDNWLKLTTDFSRLFKGRLGHWNLLPTTVLTYSDDEGKGPLIVRSCLAESPRLQDIHLQSNFVRPTSCLKFDFCAHFNNRAPLERFER